MGSVKAVSQRRMRCPYLRRRRVGPSESRSYWTGGFGLEAILLHPTIERAATEAEGLGGLGHVSLGASERLLDKNGFDGFEAKVIETLRRRSLRIQTEIGDA